MKKLILVLILLSSSYFIYRYKFADLSFPTLAPGYYFGSIEVKSLSDKPHKLFVKVTSDKKIIISLVDTKFTYFDTLTSEPIELKSAVDSLILSGQQDAENNLYYNGTATLVSTNEVGAWQIERIDYSADRNNSEPSDKLELLASLEDEYQKVNNEYQVLDDQYKKLLNESTQLSDLINNPETLKDRAKEKLQRVQQSNKQLEQEIVKLQQSVSSAEQQVALAYRVTQQGTLVQLARESLQRESRWVESMFRSDVNASEVNLEEQLQNAKEVLALKALINEERDKIFMLENRNE